MATLWQRTVGDDKRYRGGKILIAPATRNLAPTTHVETD